MSEIDYPAFAGDLLALLDRIAVITDDPDIQTLCDGRHDLAEKHGFEIVFYPDQVISEQ